MTKELQKIKGAFGVKELALLYFPNSTPSSARAQLNRWINDTILIQKLKLANYRKGQHIFTPRQVEIIIQHLGYP